MSPTTNPEHVDDRLPDILLADIGGAEAERILDHLRVCVACGDAWRVLQALDAELIDGAEPTEPPAAVRGRLIAKARGAAVRRRLATTARTVLPAFAGAAAASALWLVLGHAVAVPGPAVGRPVASLEGEGTGRVYLALRAGRATLRVKHLPPLAAGYVYEAWWVGRRHLPAATFGVDRSGDATTTLALPKGWISSDRFGVTVEPAPGTAQPTTSRVLGGSLSGL